MNHKRMESELARICGELGHWCWINRDQTPRQAAGWVDAVVLTGRAAFFIELKADDGRVTLQQQRVASLLRRAGLEYRLWRPGDFENGIVKLDLAEVSG